MRNRILLVIALCAAAGVVRAQGLLDKASAGAGSDESTPPTTSAAADAPLIVLDPGHGGGNTGAPGAVDDLREKHVTLALALALAPRLEQRGYRVQLTRQDDRYLTLRQRADLANLADADLFVSLHANAAPNHAQRGYETYVMSERAVDVDARALRMGAGPPRPGVDEEVAAILNDVERGLAQPAAADLAARIQAELRSVRDPADDRGVKQESMHVLLGATMPAVLVEVGFVDHASEGRELATDEVRSAIADALARAIAASLPTDDSDR